MAKISELVRVDELGRVIGEVKLRDTIWYKHRPEFIWHKRKPEYWFMPLVICDKNNPPVSFVGIDSEGNGLINMDSSNWEIWTPPEETVEITEGDFVYAFHTASMHPIPNNHLVTFVDPKIIWQELLKIAKGKE